MAKKMSRLLALALLALSSVSLQAQLGLYGAFTAQNLGPNSSGYDYYGGAFGAYLASGQLALLSAGVEPSRVIRKQQREHLRQLLPSGLALA